MYDTSFKVRVYFSIWSSLTRTLIPRGAVIFRVVTTHAGILIVAPVDVMADVGGAIIAFLQGQSLEGCACWQRGNSGGWRCAERYAVNLDLVSIWYTLAPVDTSCTYFLKTRSAEIALPCFKRNRRIDKEEVRAETCANNRNNLLLQATWRFSRSNAQMCFWQHDWWNEAQYYFLLTACPCRTTAGATKRAVHLESRYVRYI